MSAPARGLGARPREDTCDSTPRDTVDTKMRFIALSTSGLAPSSGTSGNGGASTHCRTGTAGSTWSTRKAAVWAMRRVEQDGQTVRGMALGWI